MPIQSLPFRVGVPTAVMAMTWSPDACAGAMVAPGAAKVQVRAFADPADGHNLLETCCFNDLEVGTAMPHSV